MLNRKHGRLITVLPLFLALVMAPIAFSTPAEAKAKKVHVSIKANKKQVVKNSVITINGKGSARAKKASVVLQQRVGKGKWRTVKKGKTTNSRKYSFKVRPAKANVYSYRVKVSKKKKVRTSYSKAVKVRALNPKPPATPKPVGPSLEQQEITGKENFIKWVNDRRQSLGLPLVKENVQLSDYNKQWATKESASTARPTANDYACTTLGMPEWDVCQTLGLYDGDGHDRLMNTVKTDEWYYEWFDHDWKDVEVGVGYAISKKDGTHFLYYTIYANYKTDEPELSN